jgi:G3E family GTPase
MQLEEADIILITKTDLLEDDELQVLERRTASVFPQASIRGISARLGYGLDEWLREVLSESYTGTRNVEVDYDLYAEGEAELGWLNADVLFSGSENTDWRRVCERLLARLQSRFREEEAEVAHLKAILSTSNGYLQCNLTRLDAEIHIEGEAEPGSEKSSLTVNARVQMSPQNLKREFHQALKSSLGPNIRTTLRSFSCFEPARPVPSFHFSMPHSTTKLTPSE